MKKMARFGLVLVLVALASPATAGPSGGLTPIPYCWDVDNTSCQAQDEGQIISCTDGTWYDYICECSQFRNYTGPYPWDYTVEYRWDCSEVR